MPDEPISNPGVSPTPKVPEYGREKPRLGEGEEAQQPKPFTLGPEGAPGAQEVSTPPGKPSLMEVAGDSSRQQAQLPPEQLAQKIEHLQDQLKQTQIKLQDTNVTGKLSNDHGEALNRLADKMSPDMRTIANNSNGEFKLPEKAQNENALSYVTRWINGSQQTLSNALNYVSNEKSPNIGSYLKLQYAVQRSTQRGELFASIIGASVSGIKTIMSTQLG